MKSIKGNLKEWTKKFFGNPHEKLKENAQKISMVENKLIHDPESYGLNS